METTNPPRIFLPLYLRWLLVHGLGLPLSYLLGLLLSVILGPETGILIMATPAMIVGAMVFSYVQWRTLIRIEEIKGIWIALSGAGLAALYLIAFWHNDDPTFSPMIAGAALGVAQFLILRKRVAGAVWWIPASLIAWLAVFFIYNLGGLSIGISNDSPYVAIGLLGLIVGAITGIPYAISFSEQKKYLFVKTVLGVVALLMITVQVLSFLAQQEQAREKERKDAQIAELVAEQISAKFEAYSDHILFSPDGKILAIANRDQVEFRSSGDWGIVSKIFTVSYDSIRDMSFSPDGQILALATRIGDSHVIELWDVMNYKHICSLTGHKDDVEAVAFSPDGNLIASGGGRNDAQVLFWNQETCEFASKIQTTREIIGEVQSVAFSPDGRFLAVAKDDGIALFHVKTGRIQERLEGFTNPVYKVLFSADGRYLAASSKGIVQIYDGSTWKEIRTLTVDSWWVTSFAFSPDSRALAVQTHNTNVGLWNIETGTLLVELQGPVDATYVTVSPDGQWIVSAEDHESCSSTEACMVFVWSLPKFYP